MKRDDVLVDINVARPGVNFYRDSAATDLAAKIVTPHCALYRHRMIGVDVS